MTSPEGFSLHVTVWIDPANVDKFMEHFKPVYDMVISQPECQYFEVYQSFEDPGQLSWVENWTGSFDWFKESMLTRPEYVPYLEATTPMWVKPREFKVLKRWGAPYHHHRASVGQ